MKLDHQFQGICVELPPDELLGVVTSQVNQTVKSLRFNQVPEQQHQQTFAVEGFVVDAEADRHRTHTDFQRPQTLRFVGLGQDAVHRFGTQGTVVGLEAFVFHHFDVAVDVEGVQAGLEQKGGLVVCAVVGSRQHLVFVELHHVDEVVVGFSLFVTEKAEIFVFIDGNVEGLGGEIFDEAVPLLFVLGVHLSLFSSRLLL